MKCFVYRNLHKEGCHYSLRALEGEFKGRVIGYARTIVMEDVEFFVSQKGRSRVLKRKQKNVHAGLIGEIMYFSGYEERLQTPEHSDVPVDMKFRELIAVTYNPYLYEQFVTVEQKKPVMHASRVIVSNVVYARLNRP